MVAKVGTFDLLYRAHHHRLSVTSHCLVALCVVCVFCLTKSWAGEARKSSQLSLLPTADSVQAGEGFSLGLLMQHRPGFHSYWKHPGDVGVALKIDWELPDGVEFTHFEWSLPERVMMADFPAHGYRNDALHRAHFTLSEEFPHEEFRIRGRAHWMSCKNMCQLMHQEIEIVLPVRNGVEPKANGELAAYRDVTKVREERVRRAELQDGEAGSYVLRLHLEKTYPEGELYFFFDSPSIQSERQQVCRWVNEKLVEIVLHESEYADARETMLSGLLFFETGQVYAPVNFTNYENVK